MSKKEPFNCYEPVRNLKWYLYPIEFIAAKGLCLLNGIHTHVDKEAKKMKGPFLVLSTHQSFHDFPALCSMLMPRSTRWVISVEEFRGREQLFRNIGAIPKRKFTHSLDTVKNILKSIKEGKNVAFYPEARYEFAGINEPLDDALGKLCKKAGVPVLMSMNYGNYLREPQWHKKPNRKIRMDDSLYVLFTKEQVAELSAKELQSRIEEAFKKDEYKWQVEHNYEIKAPDRAEGLHRILYKCPHCGQEFKMTTFGTFLKCDACGSTWELDTLNRLKGVNTDKGFSHIPDWYLWERDEVKKEVEAGTYHFEDDVRIEEFFNGPVGVIPVGEGHLVHDEHGFTITGTVRDKEMVIKKPVNTMYSCHVEFNFDKKGDAVDIAYNDTTYMVFLKTAPNQLTKLQFATIELYNYYVRDKQN